MDADNQVYRCRGPLKFFWNAEVPKTAFTDASCACGTLPLHGRATPRDGRSFIHWQLSRFDDESDHSQQQAAEGESCSGLQQSTDGLGCF